MAVEGGGVRQNRDARTRQGRLYVSSHDDLPSSLSLKVGAAAHEGIGGPDGTFHYHIRWSGRTAPDWECFSTRERR